MGSSFYTADRSLDYSNVPISYELCRNDRSSHRTHTKKKQQKNANHVLDTNNINFRSDEILTKLQNYHKKPLTDKDIINSIKNLKLSDLYIVRNNINSILNMAGARIYHLCIDMIRYQLFKIYSHRNKHRTNINTIIANTVGKKEKSLSIVRNLKLSILCW